MPISFFSRKPRSALPAPAPAEEAPPWPPETSYNPQLVATLKQQHRDMAMLLHNAKNSVRARHYEEVKVTLDRLRNEIAEHMRRETDELHAYLIARITSPDRRAILKDMHAGALRTGRALQGFLQHYGGYPVTERNAGIFYKEIDGVTEEFDKWIRQEESDVYSLYQPPEAY